MEIVIDIEDPAPLFAQLVEQVKQAVQKEEIRPGDSLPSIRQLANDLQLNSKTVAKAYKLLERDEVIQARGYRGTFVHPEARSNCEVDISAWVSEQLNRTIDKLKASGATDSEIRIAFGSLMNNRNL